MPCLLTQCYAFDQASGDVFSHIREQLIAEGGGALEERHHHFWLAQLRVGGRNALPVPVDHATWAQHLKHLLHHDSFKGRRRQIAHGAHACARVLVLVGHVVAIVHPAGLTCGARTEYARGAPAAQGLPLLPAWRASGPGQSGVEHGHHLRAARTRVCLPCGRDRSVLSA